MDLVMQSQIPWYEFHYFFSVKLDDLMNLYRLQYRKARYAKPVSEYIRILYLLPSASQTDSDKGSKTTNLLYVTTVLTSGRNHNKKVLGREKHGKIAAVSPYMETRLI
jgi:hypothetical protein